ncbi:hypothetical protein [Caproiciproducens sp. LBM24188]|nr:hypothetical protein [Clostridiales bacterium]
MNENRATVILNKTIEGLSVIGIDLYVASRRLHTEPSRRFIDDLNKTPLLDREMIKNMITKTFGIPGKNIYFSD